MYRIRTSLSVRFCQYYQDIFWPWRYFYNVDIKQNKFLQQEKKITTVDFFLDSLSRNIEYLYEIVLIIKDLLFLKLQKLSVLISF